MKLIQSKYNYEIKSKIKIWEYKKTISKFSKYGEIILSTRKWSIKNPLYYNTKLIIQMTLDVDFEEIKTKINKAKNGIGGKYE